MTLNWKVCLLSLVGAVALGVFCWWLFFLRGFGAVVLSTGQEGGTYTVIGEGFSEYVDESEARFRVEARASRGTEENLNRLKSGEADSEEVRVVAKLYSEVLHIVVPRLSELRAVDELSEKRICLGEKGSGSRVVSEPLLAHFGVSDFEEVALPPKEALRSLREGKLDAVMLVTALNSESIRDAVRGGELRFLSIGNAGAGLVARFPFLEQSAVPAMTYRCDGREEGAMPSQAITAIGVPSLLVSREGVSAEVVYEVTSSLFASRNKLSRLSPEAYQISEVTAEDLFPWSLHEGAQRYYRRREPGFFERYSDVMALLISLGAAAWAVWGVVSRWTSRKKKNRIDDYYLEVAATFLRLEEELSAKSLREERGRLANLRNRAFQDLAQERLKADDSFGIFQDQLALCLEDVRHREALVQSS